MLEILAITLIIIFSPVILIAGFFSLMIIIGLIYLFMSILIGVPKEVVKQVRRKWQEKSEGQQNIIKNTVKK